MWAMPHWSTSNWTNWSETSCGRYYQHKGFMEVESFSKADIFPCEFKIWCKKLQNCSVMYGSDYIFIVRGAHFVLLGLMILYHELESWLHFNWHKLFKVTVVPYGLYHALKIPITRMNIVYNRIKIYNY